MRPRPSLLLHTSWALALVALGLGCGSTRIDTAPDGASLAIDAPGALHDGSTTGPGQHDAERDTTPTMHWPPAEDVAMDDAQFGVDDAVVQEDDVLGADGSAIEGNDARAQDALAGSVQDTASPCSAGAHDECPASPSPCRDLADEPRQVLRLEGFAPGIASACEGSVTRLGPDAVLPLTLQNPRDVVITVRPGSGDVATVSLVRMQGCGTPGAELRCSNSSTRDANGIASVRAQGLPAGRYGVVVSSAAGRAVTVQAQLSAPSPRERGDVCPGIVLSVDRASWELRTQTFEPHADYASPCLGDVSPRGLVDAVVAYTLPALRDVTLDVRASGTGSILLDVSDACGTHSASPPRCAVGSPARLVLRRQPPGTYFVTITYAGAPGRTLTASAHTAPPTPVSSADACPGSPLDPDAPRVVSVASLSPDTTLACLPRAQADAYFEVAGPPVGTDLIALAQHDARAPVALELRDRCDAVSSAQCLGGAPTAWRRFAHLQPGARYTLAVGAESPTGSLSVRTVVVPAQTPGEARDNTRCSTPFVLDAAGGVVLGDNAAASWGAQSSCGGLSCTMGRTVWFSITLPTRRRLLAHTVGTHFDTMLALSAGDCSGRILSGACSHRTLGNAALLDVTLDPGTYRIALSGCGVTARGAYRLDVATVPP